jgi:hypothetical protein
MRRSDSRRDTDSANNFDISSRRSMIDTFVLEGKRIASRPRSHSPPPWQLP